MAEAFMCTFKRDNPTPDAQIVMHTLPKRLTHYNELHPRLALDYRSPRESTADRSTKNCLYPLCGL
jgi:putative transposase